MDVVKSNVNKIAPFFVDNIIIADQLLALLDSSNLKEAFDTLSGVGVYTDTNFSLANKIHLGNFLIFFVDDSVDCV